MKKQRLALRLAMAVSTVIAALPGNARAQEFGVSRRSYSYWENRLDIEVLANSAGQLQIIRGADGEVEVAANAQQGVAGFGLASESNVLRLAAAGANQANYIVVVPERMHVRVRLPGVSEWRTADRSRAAMFNWGAVTTSHEKTPAETGMPMPSLDGRYFTVMTRSDAPATVRLVRPERIKSVEVRVEGTEFSVSSSRPMTRLKGGTSVLEVDPGDADIELVLTVPTFARPFELLLEGKTLLTVRGGEPVERCGPVIRQKSSAGAWRVMFLPASGVSCRTQ